MKVLIDSHVLVWALLKDARLSTRAKRIFSSEADTVSLSLVSLWELSLKISRGKLRTIGSSIAYFRDECREYGIEIVPLRFEHILQAESLPMYHRDPFDRLLIAQAMVEEMTVLTRNAEFGRYGVKVVW